MDILSYLMGQNSAIKKGMKVEVVTELPETGTPNVIYLVPKQDTGDNDVFDEYLYVDDDWELIGTTDIDLSGYQTTIQYSTMPTASADTVGKIVQYIGATSSPYTNGYFYKGTSTTENNDTTYSWIAVDVQAHQSISGKEDTSNKVTSLSASSTDIEYPSAKAVYDALSVAGGGIDIKYMEDLPNNFVLNSSTSDDVIDYINLSGLTKGIYISKTFASSGTLGTKTVIYRHTSTSTGSTAVNWTRILVLADDIPSEQPTSDKYLGFVLTEDMTQRQIIMIANTFNYYPLKFGVNRSVLTRVSQPWLTNKWTFEILPEMTSSTVPSTTDKQLTTKYYVDNAIATQVGNISTVLSSLTTVSGGE